MRKVVIVGGARTAVGGFGGSLKDVSAVELGALAVNAALQKAGLVPEPDAAMRDRAPETLKDAGPCEPEKAALAFGGGLTPVAVDEVVMGNVLQAGLGQNPARQAMIRAGVPKETPACTVNKVCGSGLKAIAMGAASILAGQADVVVAGGMENMSRVPMALPKARWGHRMELTGKGEVTDLMVFDGLYEIFYGYHMGRTAENIARMYGISRQEQDELGALSHQRAMAAINNGWFAEEIVPATIKTRKGDVTVDRDERPMETSVEKMGKLRPVFASDGTVTAGNASGINDAGAAVVLMSAEKAADLGLSPLAAVKSFASGGVDPAYMGLGPVPAVKQALSRAGMALSDIDVIEVNEAFAAQVIGCARELKFENDRPNELGSGISLGHPIGCTGARQTVTAVHHMRRKDAATALITMCIGGGMGMAMVLERA